MYVADLERMKEFFTKHFNATSNTMYHNPKTGLRSYFLTFDDGARLEIMTRPGLTDNGSQAMVYGLTHISFKVGSKNGVDSLTDTLLSEGYEAFSMPRTTGDGYYESCMIGPEGILIEITE